MLNLDSIRFLSEVRQDKVTEFLYQNKDWLSQYSYEQLRGELIAAGEWGLAKVIFQLGEYLYYARHNFGYWVSEENKHPFDDIAGVPVAVPQYSSLKDAKVHVTEGVYDILADIDKLRPYNAIANQFYHSTRALNMLKILPVGIYAAKFLHNVVSGEMGEMAGLGNLNNDMIYATKGLFARYICGWPMLPGEFTSALVIDQQQMRAYLQEHADPERPLRIAFMLNEIDIPSTNDIADILARRELLKQIGSIADDRRKTDIYLGSHVPARIITHVLLPLHAVDLMQSVQQLAPTMPVLSLEVSQFLANFTGDYSEMIVTDPQIRAVLQEFLAEVTPG